MTFSASLNPKKSIFISLLSGVGLLAVIGVAPTREEVQTEKEDIIYQSSQEESKNNSLFKSVIKKRNSPKESKVPSLLNFRIRPEDLKEFKQNLQIRRDKLGSLNNSYGRILHIKNFISSRNMNSPGQSIDSRSLIWEDNGTSIQTRHSFQPIQFQAQGYGNMDPFRSRMIRSNNIEFLDLDIPISRSVSAVFTTSSGDVFDDRTREGYIRNYALAGVSLNKGDIVSTRFVAGDPNMQIHRQRMNPGYYGATNAQSFREMGLSERESAQLRSFEWQTNIKPTKAVRLQTALYNNPQVNSIQNQQQRSNMPDSGRMSLFLGEKRVIMNVKYDYQMSQQNVREMMTQWQPKQDAASLGFIFFLDPSQKYSIYLGGNQFNVSERMQGSNRNSSSSEQLPASFTASFRGKTKGNENSSFFVNFQNQPPGAWGLGMPNQIRLQDQSNLGSKSFYEYATTLGLEVNF